MVQISCHAHEEKENEQFFHPQIALVPSRCASQHSSSYQSVMWLRRLSLWASFSLFFFPLLSATSTNNAPVDDIQLFQNWFLSNGGEVTGLTIHDFSDMGRGLLTTKNISKNERVLFIPKKMILSSHLAKTSSDPLHRHLIDSFPKDHELMIAFLLLEKSRSKESFWFPYLKVLPQYVPNLAQFDREELSELQNPSYSNEVMATWHQTVQSYNYFLEKIVSYWPVPSSSSSSPPVTLQEYLWASSIIDSRGFRFHGEINLAPYSDMFNYSPHPDPRPSDGGNFFLEHHHLTDDGLVVLADRPSIQGVQLFEDYGDNSDRIYLQYHGFMPTTNPFRCQQISTLPIDHPTLPKNKQNLLKEFRFTKAPMKCIDETGQLILSFFVSVSVSMLSQLFTPLLCRSIGTNIDHLFDSLIFE
jgi:hypothetical protein